MLQERLHNKIFDSLVFFRRLFKEPEVTPAEELDLKWEKPDEEGLVSFDILFSPSTTLP